MRCQGFGWGLCDRLIYAGAAGGRMTASVASRAAFLASNLSRSVHPGHQGGTSVPEAIFAVNLLTARGVVRTWTLASPACAVIVCRGGGRLPRRWASSHLQSPHARMGAGGSPGRRPNPDTDTARGGLTHALLGPGDSGTGTGAGPERASDLPVAHPVDLWLSFLDRGCGGRVGYPGRRRSERTGDGGAYAGRVHGASEAGMRLLAEIVSDRLSGPQILYDAWDAGRIADEDLRELIPETWLYVDWPERIIGTDNWVRLFRAAGFLTIPYGLTRPTSAVTVYRVPASARWACPGRRISAALTSSASGILACADGGLPGYSCAGGSARAAGTQGRRPTGSSGGSSEADAYRAGQSAAPAALPPGCLTADADPGLPHRRRQRSYRRRTVMPDAAPSLAGRFEPVFCRVLGLP